MQLFLSSFKVDFLNKGTKSIVQPRIAVLIFENIGPNLGKLLSNGLWIYTLLHPSNL